MKSTLGIKVYVYRYTYYIYTYIRHHLVRMILSLFWYIGVWYMYNFLVVYKIWNGIQNIRDMVMEKKQKVEQKKYIYLYNSDTEKI